MFTALALAAATMAMALADGLPAAPVESVGVVTYITLSVHAAPKIKPAIVAAALDEAAAVWRGSGVALRWTIDPRDAEPADPGCALRVVIEDAPPAARGTMMPLGWIGFDGSNTPTDEIHLSFSNVMTLIQDAEGADVASRLTHVELNLLTSRALGRALAHEIGHYLLGSKEHTRSGLMQSGRPATDFFSPGRERFAIAPAQLKEIASRWTHLSASSHP